MSPDTINPVISSGSLRTRRILVIDDNRAIHSDFRKLLIRNDSSRGLDLATESLFGEPAPIENRPEFELHSAYQGQEGLAAVQNAILSGTPFEMAFVDVRMPPGWDGIETVTELWKVDPDLEIVICTAYSDYDLDDLTAKFGFTDKFFVLKKPFDKIEVVQLANACTTKWFLGQQVKEQARNLNQKAQSLQIAHDTLEERVRQRTEELRKLSHAIEQSPVAVVITNTQAEIEYTNPHFSRISGYSAQEVIGKNPSLLESGQTPSEVFRNLWETLKRGEVWCGEFCNRHKNGHLYWESATIAPLRSHDGMVTHYIAIQQDVSERKRAEEQLQDTNKRLELASARANEMAAKAELASAAKSQFLANMSHEIRTPLNGVLGITELLLDSDLTPEQRQYATVAQHSGQALLSILNDILDFSKIESGKLELETIDFELRDPFEEATEILATRAAEKGLPIVSVIEPTVPTSVRGDPVRLRQVLLNLGSNAIKFTSKGEVVLRLVVERSDERSATIRVTVTDTGPGIKQDKLHKLFSPFVQVDNSTTRKFGGTGLGLAISKQLVELMGGRIGISSQVGKGSSFWFTAELQVSKSSSRNRTNPQRVLIVDPHAATRMSLGLMLESLGYQWIEASNATEALSSLCRCARDATPIQAVLLDKSFIQEEPDLLRQIRAELHHPDTKLVLLGGLIHRHKDAEPNQRAGLESLTKPVRLAALRECLEHGKNLPESGVRTKKSARVPILVDSTCEGLILVADDNPTNQMVAIKFLEKLGLKADAVFNGLEAIDALSKRNYNLVLIDGQMPEMGGLEATRQIRSGKTRALNPAIPIIGLTASVLKGDRELCFEAGMDDYLQKPLDPKLLAQVVTRWLNERNRHEPRKNGAATPPVSPANDSAMDLAPVFERQTLMERVMGDAELEESLIATYLADLPNQLAAFRTAFATGNLNLVAQAAHRMRGAASAINGTRLEKLALNIEIAASQGERDTVRNLEPRLQTDSDELCRELQRRAQRF